MADINDLGPGFPNLNKRIKEENEELREELGIYRDITNEAQRLARSLELDKATRTSILNITKNLNRLYNEQLDNLDEQIKGQRSINDVIKSRGNIQKALNKLESEQSIIVRQISKTRDTISFKDKELAKARKDKNVNEISSLGEQVKKYQHQLFIYNSINEKIQEYINNQDVLIKNLEDEEKLVTGINKSLGLAPTLLMGIDKSLRKLGFGDLANQLNINEALNSTKLKMAEVAANGGKPPGALKTAGILAGQLGNSFSKILTRANLLAFALVSVVNGILKADKAQAALQRNFNLSREAARDIRRDFAEIANKSESLFVTAAGLQEAFTEINKALGTAVKLRGKELETFRMLTKQAGFSNELSLIAFKTGVLQTKESEKLVKTALGEIESYKARNKIILNTKEILEDITKISSFNSAILGDQIDKLARISAEARGAGTTVETIQRSAQGLLDFESSISAELEAQLMTGRDINLNRAREAALMGDLETVTKEIKANAGSWSEFQKLNVLSAGSLARSLSMSNDDLANMVRNESILTKLSAQEGETAQQAFIRLVKEVGLEQAKARLGDEALARQYQSVSNQEKLAAMGDKLLEIFVQIGDVVMPVFNGIASTLGFIVPQITKLTQGMLGGWREVGKEVDNVMKLLGFENGMGATMNLLGKAVKVAFLLPMTMVKTTAEYILSIFRSISAALTGAKKLLSGDVKGAFSSAGDVFKNNPGFSLYKSAYESIKSIPQLAEGGIVNSPTLSMIGESGPEAVVPLNQYNGGNGELQELNRNIKVLIDTVRQGKTIQMNGYNVGVAVAMDTLKTQ